MTREPNFDIDPPDIGAPLRRTIWLTLLFAIVVYIGATQYVRYRLLPAEVEARKAQAFPGPSRAVFENASQITLYSLDSSMPVNFSREMPRLSPTSSPGHFHGYPILGQTVLSEADRARVVAAIYGGFAERRIGRGFCFLPHHGLRAIQGKQNVDLVICFKCTTLETYSANLHGSSPISRASENYFNNLLTAADVPFGPDYKP